MDDAALVRVGERPRDVAQDADDFGDRERPARRAARAATRPRRTASCSTAAPSDLAGGEHGNDVRLLERAPPMLDLALEALDADVRPRAPASRTLMTTLRPSARFVGDEDARHAAAAELTLEGVGRTERLLQLVAKGHPVPGEETGAKVGARVDCGQSRDACGGGRLLVAGGCFPRGVTGVPPPAGFAAGRTHGCNPDVREA